ncbi:MAG: hypothetical protein ACPG4Z_06135 [Chitinophagales bacterium]
MEEKIKDELRDDMLSHMIQETGYDASVDFTARIMEKVNPPKKEKTFTVKEIGFNWGQLAGITTPLIILIMALGYALSNGNFDIAPVLTEVLSSQAFYISLAVGFSTIMFFSLNQYIFRRK